MLSCTAPHCTTTPFPEIPGAARRHHRRTARSQCRRHHVQVLIMKPSLAASFSFLFFYIFKFYTPNPPQPLKKNLPFKPSTNFKTFFNLPNPLICIPTLLSLSNPPVNNLTLLPPSKLCCNFATLRSPFQHFYLLLYLHVVFQTHFQPSNPSCHIPHCPIKFTKILSPSHLPCHFSNPTVTKLSSIFPTLLLSF